MVSAMRSSNAPTISAPLPLRGRGAAGDAEPRGIDLRGGRRLLERVDETADAPRPGDQRPRGVGTSVEVVEHALAARAAALLLGDGIVGEGDGRDAHVGELRP